MTKAPHPVGVLLGMRGDLVEGVSLDFTYIPRLRDQTVAAVRQALEARRALLGDFTMIVPPDRIDAVVYLPNPRASTLTMIDLLEAVGDEVGFNMQIETQDFDTLEAAILSLLFGEGGGDRPQ